MIVLGDGLYVVDVTELNAKVEKLTVDCLEQLDAVYWMNACPRIGMNKVRE